VWVVFPADDDVNVAGVRRVAPRICRSGTLANAPKGAFSLDDQPCISAVLRRRTSPNARLGQRPLA
jgi:hypothetical protein